MRMRLAVFTALIGAAVSPAFAAEWKFIPGARNEDWPATKIAVLSNGSSAFLAYFDQIEPPRTNIAASDSNTRKTEVVTQYVAKIPANPTADFHMVTSPDFTRIAMTEPYGKDRWYIAADDKVWEFYEKVDPASLQFSEDSKHIVCAALWKNWWYIVLDNHGKAAELPGKPTEVRFMPDKKSVAYIAHDEKSACAVIAGVAGPAYEDVRELTFSADGKQVAYVATKGGKQFVVLAGKETPAKQVVSKLIFAKDGLRWVKFEKKDASGSVILEAIDHEIKRWDLKTEFRRASLSPDGEVVAIVDAPEKDGKFERISTNGVELSKQYEKIDRLTWGPNNLLAFVGDIVDKSAIFPDEIVNTRHALIVGGKEDEQQYNEIRGRLTFTDGGKEVTFYGVPTWGRASNLTCATWDHQEKSSRQATLWNELDNKLYSNLQVGAQSKIISPFGQQNVNDMVLDVRPDGTHKKNLLVATPKTMIINDKPMMDVTLYSIRESGK